MRLSDPLVPARILIVDDEAANTRALCSTLADNGYEPSGFTSGADALDAMKESEFELLLTDLMMPGIDGIAMLRGALELDPDIAGIVMTGQGTITTAVEAMKTGAIDYILKPFQLSVILPVLSRARTLRRLRLDNKILEQSVRERTAELEAANQELEAFSYSVSHDLRAPLRAMDGFSGILMEDYGPQLPEEAQKLLKRVRTNAAHMGQLIEDLLKLSRLGRQTLSKQSVNVAALVDGVIKDLREQEPGRSLEVRIGELPECVGDPFLLQQVFVNLIGNAFKFTGKKENALIEVGCLSQDREHVYFVRDNGAGFDPRYADKLFGAFQRLHRVEDFSGTGIGLSLVRRIVQRHSGRVWAEAELEKGATFHFSIPV
jgi:two-component system, sensor histidine kinase and response regulator